MAHQLFEFFKGEKLFITIENMYKQPCYYFTQKQSCLIPLLANDAAIGIVPYIHSGEAIPNKFAGITPNIPILFPFIRSNSP